MYKRDCFARRTLFFKLVLIIVSMQVEIESQNVWEEPEDLNYLELYFQNDRLVDFQSKCLFEDAPCDIIGRWLKPKLASGLLGTNCHQCSTHQMATLSVIIARLKQSRPEVYEKALIAFLTDRQLLDHLKKEFLHISPPLPSPQTTTQQPFLKIFPENNELLKTAASSFERRHLDEPNIAENIIPGKPRRTNINTSLLDIFVVPRSSHSFTIPILTKF